MHAIIWNSSSAERQTAAHRQTERHSDIQQHRQTDRQQHRQTAEHTDKQTDSRTHRQTDASDSVSPLNVRMLSIHVKCRQVTDLFTKVDDVHVHFLFAKSFCQLYQLKDTISQHQLFYNSQSSHRNNNKTEHHCNSSSNCFMTLIKDIPSESIPEKTPILDFSSDGRFPNSKSKI